MYFKALVEDLKLGIFMVERFSDRRGVVWDRYSDEMACCRF